MQVRFFMLYDFLLFFFSSRRRHTRLQGDWSSDVCSSDLGNILCQEGQTVMAGDIIMTIHAMEADRIVAFVRSEERRVGKECRSRGSPYHGKKKRGEWRIEGQG